MRARRILLSRFVIVPALLAAVVAGWNAYVSLHDHGLLTGRVVDAQGQPVEGATVILFTHDFVTQVEKARTKTEAGGVFRFTKNDSHLVQLQAEEPGQRSPRITVRLWFRAQDRTLRTPLQLAPAG
jgi:Carboxypeptidase regulatory-like domain